MIFSLSFSFPLSEKYFSFLSLPLNFWLSLLPAMNSDIEIWIHFNFLIKNLHDQQRSPSNLSRQVQAQYDTKKEATERPETRKITNSFIEIVSFYIQMDFYHKWQYRITRTHPRFCLENIFTSTSSFWYFFCKSNISFTKQWKFFINFIKITLFKLNYEKITFLCCWFFGIYGSCPLKCLMDVCELDLVCSEFSWEVFFNKICNLIIWKSRNLPENLKDLQSNPIKIQSEPTTPQSQRTTLIFAHNFVLLSFKSWNWCFTLTDQKLNNFWISCS